MTAGPAATRWAWVSAVMTAVMNTTTRADITQTDVAPGAAGTETSGTTAVACAACHHAPLAHDSIARRYCTATVAGGFNRQCVCVGGHKEAVKETS